MFTKDKRAKNNESKYVMKGIFFLIAFSLFSFTTNAQCAMCRAAIESEGNMNKAEAVNDGIVYLMVIPYLLAAGIGYAVYRIYRNKKTN